MNADTLAGNSSANSRALEPVDPSVVSLKLALAVIASSNAPILLLDGNLKVVVASTSFCVAFDMDLTTAQGHQLAQIGAGEWNIPQLLSLLRATAAGFAEVKSYEMELHCEEQPARHLSLNAQKLEYAESGSVRLLLTVSDITAARNAEKLKDDLVREKAVMLQELQHRVANSLQIIASVLLQSARKVQSDETRKHLHDAHHRVMSVAALQQQLASSTLGDVELRPYFTALCESIGASMIHDHSQLSLEVTTDDSVIGADASVSLGLIVTELVINALKHAFPNNRSGKITVAFHTQDTTWTLSVSDNGIGMPSNPESAKPGLGTSIVRALVQQLKASVEVTNANPGTIVSIICAPTDSSGTLQTMRSRTPAV